MARRRPGWVPHQHGAWAMLALPFAVGAWRGIAAHGPRPALVALLVTWFVGYFAYDAVGLWLKSRRKARYARPAQVYAVAAAATGLTTVALDARLLWWAPWFVPLLAVGLWASAHRSERTVLAGGALVAAASLMTLVAAAACLPPAAPAGWDASLVPVAGAAGFVLAYLFGTVLYVKSMIRERGVRSYAVASVAYHAVVCAVAGVSAVLHDLTWWWATALLAVLTVRAWAVLGRAVTPLALGLGEVAASAAVLAVAVALH
ncbi:hypothetical protein ET495_09730 [Xylanimonas allomyrinae]|uniref:YwiC-like family protein n=1 Tax=Xylanimonas allomyrinae TaxID=2509459 RepID=A0A4P6EM73_9MICO|nr:YwiC-like family protein [Xylanimonas allomyrinae]QAY63485.1 hypothetical protein ET495_09730 [Xylanimonas allomyrinae]